MNSSPWKIDRFDGTCHTTAIVSYTQPATRDVMWRHFCSQPINSLRDGNHGLYTTVQIRDRCLELPCISAHCFCSQVFETILKINKACYIHISIIISRVGGIECIMYTNISSRNRYVRSAGEMTRTSKKNLWIINVCKRFQFTCSVCCWEDNNMMVLVSHIKVMKVTGSNPVKVVVDATFHQVN